MVFKLARTWSDPAANQQGFPAPGSGRQTVGDYTPPPPPVPWQSDYPTQGTRSWGRPADRQRGMPSPQNKAQARPKGSMPNKPPIFGGVIMVETPYYDRGAAAYVPNFGYTLTNPIGAGVVALHRPQASYGLSGQYLNGSIWWTSQIIPTSVSLQGLTSPKVLEALLGTLRVQGVVRVE